MRARGKRIVLVSAAVCLSVIGLAGWALKDRFLESWYIHQIETGEAETVKLYGEKLRAIATVETVPALMGFLRRDQAKVLDRDQAVSNVFFAAVLKIGPAAMATTIRTLEEEGREKLQERFARNLDEPGEFRSLFRACLKDPDPAVRIHSVLVLLWGLGDEEFWATELRDPVIRREIRAAFKSPDPNLRRLAVRHFSYLGDLCQSLSIEASRDPEPQVRAAAIEALGHIDSEEALPIVIAAMGDPYLADVSARALENQQRLRPVPSGSPEAAAAVAALLERLKSGQGDLSSILPALGGFGPAGQALIPLASKLLERADTKYAAVSALGSMGPLAASAVPALIKILEGPSDGSWRDPATAAAVALGQIGPPARSALPALVRVVADSSRDLNFRSQAAQALGFIGGLDAEARQALVSSARGSRFFSTPFEAGEALGRLAEHDDEAFRQAVAILEDKRLNAKAREGAARGLRFAPAKFKAALPVILGVIQEPHLDQRVGYGVFDILAAMGPQAADAIPILESVRSNRRQVSLEVYRALWKIDRKYASDLIGNSEAYFLVGNGVFIAANVLAEMGPAAAEAIPDLMECFKRPIDFNACRAVQAALVAIGPASVPALIEALRSDDVIVRSQAAEVLGKIGPPAAAALAALEKAAHDVDEDDEVRRESAKALRKIRKEPAR